MANSPQPATPPGKQLDPAENVRAFRDRRLSLWQTAVTEAVAAHFAQPVTRGTPVVAKSQADFAQARAEDFAQAATALGTAIMAGQPLATAQPVASADDPAATGRGTATTVWTCNKIALQLAWAKVTNDTETAKRLGDELTMSTCDPLWMRCVEQYVSYFVKNRGEIPYRRGGDYVLDHIQLPKKATIALMADWGTGTGLATNIIEQIADKNPDLVIHLGDIYYSGTQSEIEANFLSVCRAAIGSTPLLSLSGNHDMYSGGHGYYWLVDQLGQKASYFCVRNQHWQFLAMDTGYDDFSPFSVASHMTNITNEEAGWLTTKIAEGKAASLKSILLSHHQLFSAYEASGAGPVNTLLYDRFKNQLPDVAAWFWGHEHRLAIYEPYLGLAKGRCIGCGAVPVFLDDDQLVVKFPEVPLLADPNAASQTIRLGDNGHVYDHAFVLVKLDGPAATAEYYQDSNPANPLFTEKIA